MAGLLGSAVALTSSLQSQRGVEIAAPCSQQTLRTAGAFPALGQHRRHVLPRCAAWGSHEPTPRDLANDPEAKFRRYGAHFGKSYLLQDVFESAPRVRVRTSADRARDQLADLAVLNERLAGKDAAQAAVVRQRLEYLKKRRRNWELVYQHVTRADALCTLSAIEEAAARVESLLSEEHRERHGVSALKRQLVELQGEVAEAHTRLHLTQARVEHNLRRISELKDEAARLDAAMVAGGGGAADVGDHQVQRHQHQRHGQQQVQLGQLATATAAAPGTALATRPPQPASGGAVRQRAALKPSEEAARQRQRGLYSGLEPEEALKNHWFAVSFSSKLREPSAKLAFELFGQAWVLFRDAEGRAACVADECAHRACPLSLGSVVEGQIVCAYHGWRFNGSGECTKMPSTGFCRGVSVRSLPCVEQDGFVWVWPGWEEPEPAPPACTLPPQGYRIHTEIEVEVPVEHGLLVENLLDLAHAPFTHTTTFARGWPVPDAVKFHASRLLGGYWDPYPIEMSFQPPCMTLSHIGLARPGALASAGATPADCRNHLHQLHVCLPSRAGHTRLLYRMATDFLWWTEAVPGIQRFWKHIAGQVLGEDLVLVEGQQDRMLRGGDTWRHPVSYDKLAVRYRRWRNSLTLRTEGPHGGDGRQVAAQAFTMSSGELFALDDDQQLFVDASAGNSS